MVKKKARPRPPAPAKWTRRPEDRPREILAAALTVFARRGYNATRLDDIAAAAGVTKGTIYYYFKNKDDLLLRLSAAGDREEIAKLEALIRDATGPVSAQLRMVMRKGFCEPTEEARRLMQVVFLDLHTAAPKLFARSVHNTLVEGWALIAKLIERGKATGEFRRDADAEVAVRIFTSGLILQQLWRGTTGLDKLDPFDKDRMVDSAIELFLHSLRPTVSVHASARATRGKRGTRSS